jgi:hypothetical protein
MTNELESSKRRPLGVWVVSAFYVLSGGWTLFSFALIFGGAITVTPAQEEYFASLSAVDWFFSFWFFSLAFGVIGISAAVCLFLLRRVAVGLFSVALALNLAFIAVHVFTAVHVRGNNWTEALGGAGLVSALILVAVILYARRLAKRGVLS